jgi:hypothetical protein
MPTDQRKRRLTKRHPSDPSGELLTGESGEFLAGVDTGYGSALIISCSEDHG